MTLVPLVIAVVLVVAFVALRSPVQRRLALRNANRRRNEAALVIIGSLLGTALITGSFIVGDTLDSSIRATAATQLGPIDEIVVVPDAEQASALEEDLTDLDDERIDGVLSLVGVPGSIVVDPMGDPKAEPEAQIIEVDFEEARAFGDDPAATGISGETPGPGQVAITKDVAEALSVGEGDEVSIFIYGEDRALEVVRVLPRLGVAGFWLGLESRSPNAFVAPGTIADLAGARPPKGALPPTTSVLVSNRGDVEDGAALTGEVSDVIEGALGSDVPLRVEGAKKERLESAEEQGAQFSELFLGIGAFAIIAGVLLLINIFVMLAQERKSQLGMLRAVGLRRADLVRVFVIEGFVYSLLAGILGAFMGVGVGWAIAKLAAPIFGGADEFALELRFAMTPESIVIGFCTGMLITALTIFLTSIRISRINIIRAIRDLPEPTGRTVRKRTLVLGGLLAVLSLASFVMSVGESEGWAGVILGPPVAAFGLLPLLSLTLRRRTAVLLVAGFSLLWGIFGTTIVGNPESGEIFEFVIQGILLTFSAVVILSQTTDTFEGFIRRVAARNLPVRLGLAYPVARRFRTGLILGMYALVIFTMTFIAALSNVFGGQVEDTVRRASGGFDIVATAAGTNPPTEAELERQEGVNDAAVMFTGNALFEPPDFPAPEPWPATGVDDEFVSIGPPELEERDDEYDADADVWEAVLEDPALVVIPEFFLQEGGGPPSAVVEPGESMEMVDPLTGETAEREVAGVLSMDAAFSGVYMSQESTREVLGPRATPSRFFIVAEENASATSVATDLQGTLFRNGLEADTFRAIVEEFQALNLQFFRLMQGYLALGLLVGIAGLGVVMVRAVRERRREIGVLRSLGFLAPSVRRAFLFESAFIALQGILIGAVLALITAAQLVATDAFGESAVFSVPWDDLLWLSLAALFASLLATAWPAHQASQVPPAVALRVAE